jgi:hypothetical protein
MPSSSCLRLADSAVGFRSIASVLTSIVVFVAAFAIASPARAQDAPPRIGPFVIDLHGSFAQFPSDDPQLAESRGLQTAELPGSGLGIQLGVHVYPFRVKAVTVGVGGEFAASRSSQTPQAGAVGSGGVPLLGAEERFSTVAPQLSLNFGNGNGWSYLSAGLGVSNWALVPEGQDESAADTESRKTLNYGGGARWFVRPHVAFSFDVRIYVVSPGTPVIVDTLGSPRTNLLVVSAGISVK